MKDDVEVTKSLSRRLLFLKSFAIRSDLEVYVDKVYGKSFFSWEFGHFSLN